MHEQVIHSIVSVFLIADHAEYIMNNFMGLHALLYYTHVLVL